MSLFILILLFLMLSAFFSGAEIAFISANKLGVEVLRNKGSRRGSILAAFYDKPRDFIATMLVGNNIALVVFATLMETLLRPILMPYIEETVPMLLILTIITTLVVLIFGEFIPKTLSRIYPNEILFQLSYPLNIFKWLLKIPTALMTAISNIFLRFVFKAPKEDFTSALTRIDLEHFLKDSISEEEDIDKSILNNALNLSKRKVRDCMVPRNEIVYADKQDSVEDLIRIFRSTSHSRVLIIDGDIENVIGYVHHQQLLKNPASVKRLIMEIPFVPEAMNVQDLLLKFMKDRDNIACVVDEFGGTAGVITLEDILEEIFGEIEDEHDDELWEEIQISNDEYIFSGRLEIEYLNDKYEHLQLPVGDFHTLSGYIVMTSGSIPEKEGIVLEMDGYRFIVEQISDTRIERVRVIRLKTDH
ncbi:MAG TPA: hemolysin family protein [Saprospiraceae bacterium]|nr:hemolysin family protein [Saprospiraceae bacterium]